MKEKFMNESIRPINHLKHGVEDIRCNLREIRCEYTEWNILRMLECFTFKTHGMRIRIHFQVI